MSKNKLIIAAFFAVFSGMFSINANAQFKQPVEIKYLGVVDNNPVFELNLNNSQPDNFSITIRDESGAILFSEKLSGKALTRTYRIDTEDEIPQGGLRFEVRSAKNKKTETYVAGVTKNITTEVSVTKL